MPAGASTDDPRRLLERAVAKWGEDVDRWSFVQHVREYRGRELREVRVERFDPSEPDSSRWELLSINGRPPDEGEQRAFDQRKNRKPRKRFAAPAHYIDFARVAVAAETGGTVTFDVPLRDDLSLFIPFEAVAARVEVDKETATVRRVEIGLREEMRIAFGLARVSVLRMDLRLDEPKARGSRGAAELGPQPNPTGKASAVMSTLGRWAEISWTDFVRVDPKS